MPVMLTPNPRYRFTIRDDSDPIVADGTIVHETWVENVYQLPERMDGLTVLDIGANIGVVSVYCASRGANVYAVEPEPDNLALLHKNIEVNRVGHRVTVIPAAVGGSTGQGWITASRGNGTLVGQEQQDTSPCDVYTLSDLLDINEIDAVDICKIDIEGSEYELFKQVPQATLERCAYITLEFNGTNKPTAFGMMAAKLAQYGNTHIIGRPMPEGPGGGYIYSHRY